MDFLRKTWAEIDTAALIHNLKEVRTASGDTHIIAVVKANAYGHSADILAPIMEKEGVNSFAVSNLDEALALRQIGINKSIIILGYTPFDSVQQLYDNDIIQAVYSSDYAKGLNLAAKALNITLKVHIKLDTGMGRIGFDCRTDDLCGLGEALSAARLSNFKTEGVFTHFAVSDRTESCDDGFTDNQNLRFKRAVEAFKNNGFPDIMCHTANSAATLLDNDKRYDACRPGIILYGLTPNSDLELRQKLIPVMSFKTVVTMVKDISAGDTVSYGRTFKAERPMRLASLAVGYADGYPRALSNKGYVIINGKKAPIVGRVCMDQTMVDVTDIEDVKLGDVALLFGKELPVEEIAKLTDTINYEIVTGIAPRVPRIKI